MKINIEERSKKERWYWLEEKITSLSGLNCWPAPFPHNPDALEHNRTDVRLMAHIFKVPGIVFVSFSEHMLGITLASFATWKAVEPRLIKAIKTALDTEVTISENNSYVPKISEEVTRLAESERGL